jgi:hypothetical protein
MKRTTWILIGAVLVLVLLTIIVLQQPGEVGSTEGSGEALVEYDSAAVDKLEVTGPNGAVVLEKQGNGWMLVIPVRYRADQGSVASAVGKGRDIRVKNPVSSNPGKQHLFQVDSSGTLVKMSAGGNEVAAFRVGKPGITYMETYVREEGSNDVYLAEGMFTYVFNRQAKEWRDKTIYKSEPELIRSVTYRYGDTTFTLAMNDSLWRADGDSVSQSAVQGMLSALANLQADDFVDSTLTSAPKQVALIEVDGTQIRFCEGSSPNSYLVQSSQSPQWYEVQGWRAGNVLKRRKDF